MSSNIVLLHFGLDVQFSFQRLFGSLKVPGLGLAPKCLPSSCGRFPACCQGAAWGWQVGKTLGDMEHTLERAAPERFLEESLAGGKINLKAGQDLKLVNDYDFKVRCNLRWLRALRYSSSRCRLESLSLEGRRDLHRLQLQDLANGSS